MKQSERACKNDEGINDCRTCIKYRYAI